MFSFLSRLISRRKPTKQPARGRRLANRAIQQPAIQQLEDRTLLTVLTVGTLQDVVNSNDGVLSLREAVTQANNTAASDEIQFVANLGGGKLNLTGGVLVIKNNLAIAGLTNKITIDAGGLSRIFTVNPSVSLSVDNLILQKGRTAYGGAIYVNSLSNLTLANSIVKQNVATVSGGAIYGTSQASYVITNTTFSNNTATSNGGALRFDVSGSATITNCSFVQNVADSDHSNAGDGGAIYSLGVLAVTGTTFTANEGRSGGAIYAGSGNSTTLTSSTVSSNVATLSGGAIYVFDQSGLTVTGSSFANNQAQAESGAIHLRSSGSISGTSFTGNHTVTAGGAITAKAGVNLTISASTLGNNQAASGGAIHFAGATLVIHDTHFTANQATDGGVMYLIGGSLTVDENSSFGGNSATKSGGVLYTARSASFANSNFSNNTALNGGVLYAVTSSTVTISSGVLAANVATGYGGAIYATSANVTVTGTQFTGNTAVISGGAVFQKAGAMQLTQTTLSNNSAQYSGGAIAITSNASLTVAQSTLNNNSAVGDGGAIRESSSNLTITNSVFTGNTAALLAGGLGRGGALYLLDGEVNINSSNFASNQSAPGAQSIPGADGGAIYAAGNMNVFSIGKTTFQGNIAGDDGGALFFTVNTLNLYDCLFQNNVSTDDGGAFYAKPLISGTVTNTQFVGNQAGDTGGAVFLRESNIQFIASTFTGNTAQHLHGTGSSKSGATGFLSFDSSASAHATAIFVASTIDGQLVGTPNSVAVSTSLTQTQRNAIFAQYPILEKWL